MTTKQLLSDIVKEIEPLLLKNAFQRRGTQNSFIRKNNDDYRRQEHIDFTARASRTETDAIYISGTVGLYYPTVRKIYKHFIDDHLSKYPIIAGSIGHFSPERKYVSLYYKENFNKAAIITELERNITEGAFYLINTFPDLKSIYEGITAKHEFLYQYNCENLRDNTIIEIVAMLYTLEGKQKALAWLNDNIIRNKKTEYIFEKMDNL